MEFKGVAEDLSTMADDQVAVAEDQLAVANYQPAVAEDQAAVAKDQAADADDQVSDEDQTSNHDDDKGACSTIDDSGFDDSEGGDAGSYNFGKCCLKPLNFLPLRFIIRLGITNC